MSWPRSVTKADLDIKASPARGPGGQHRNRSHTAIRITHTPTGLSAKSQETRSQHQNKRIAFRRLARKLIPLMKKDFVQQQDRAPDHRVRTYNEPDNRVVDHRVPDQQWRYDKVVHGKGLGDIIELLIRKLG